MSVRWKPHRKVGVAGIVGPVVTAGLAWLAPGLPAAGVAFFAALATAVIAYLVPGPSGDVTTGG